ncbi:hypothetical protein [Scytonema millei]|uniref:Uncharacterized protein n=1 Tax=Scytonema millei VB511283 TaxID=1245923 RepID=A0A9X5E030_9CYAN|nr:hypothetical protein [Scytonema millei]NHC33101.1 hypothetical protein [Scytonema millei VB511283]
MVADCSQLPTHDSRLTTPAQYIFAFWLKLQLPVVSCQLSVVSYQWRVESG